jgi:hypothetical protein
VRWSQRLLPLEERTQLRLAAPRFAPLRKWALFCHPIFGRFFAEGKKCEAKTAPPGAKVRKPRASARGC